MHSEHSMYPKRQVHRRWTPVLGARLVTWCNQVESSWFRRHRAQWYSQCVTWRDWIQPNSPNAFLCTTTRHWKLSGISIGNQKISEDVRIYKPALDRVRIYQKAFWSRRRGKVSIDSAWGGYLILVGNFTKRTRVTRRSERSITLLRL